MWGHAQVRKAQPYSQIGLESLWQKRHSMDEHKSARSNGLAPVGMDEARLEQREKPPTRLVPIDAPSIVLRGAPCRHNPFQGRTSNPDGNRVFQHTTYIQKKLGVGRDSSSDCSRVVNKNYSTAHVGFHVARHKRYTKETCLSASIQMCHRNSCQPFLGAQIRCIEGARCNRQVWRPQTPIPGVSGGGSGLPLKTPGASGLGKR